MIILSCLFLLLLLAFPEISLAGSRYGAALWLTQLLPTLLPFFIGIRLFNLSLPGVSSKRIFLLTGLLCGYPAGAALVADQYDRGLLDRKKACFYLGFVNNPSPMFVLVFCGTAILGLSSRESFLCLGIMILSALLGSSVSQLFFRESKNSPSPTSAKHTAPAVSGTQGTPPTFSEQLDQIILDSFTLMLKIGGYVILFSILGQCTHYLLPDSSKTAVIFRILCSGSLEITSGISYLQGAALPLITKKILTVSILAFGGLSAAAQTNSILARSGLPIRPYLISKGLSSVFAFLLSSLLFGIFNK